MSDSSWPEGVYLVATCAVKNQNRQQIVDIRIVHVSHHRPRADNFGFRRSHLFRHSGFEIRIYAFAAL